MKKLLLIPLILLAGCTTPNNEPKTDPQTNWWMTEDQTPSFSYTTKILTDNHGNKFLIIIDARNNRMAVCPYPKNP